MFEPSDRVAELLRSLSRDEKVGLVHGTIDPDGTATGYIDGVDRLDVPSLRLADGPLGVRVPGRQATAFPAAIALAATFDPGLARAQGAAIGAEARALGQDVLLGPGTNLIRVPHCGRNFEYYSEDPVHAAAFARSVVAGIQSMGVLATVKHYVANNQETDRTTVNAAIDERVLHELYLRPFRAAVEAGAGAVMTAYNAVNGTPMSEHETLLREVLKTDWGFEGFVVSDWFGTRETVASANAGLDVEMPGISGASLAESMGMDPDADLFAAFEGGMPDPTTAAMFADNLSDALASGAVPAERLDEMAGRVLGQIERLGLLDAETERGERKPEAGGLDTDRHRNLAAQIAIRGTVLLENDGVLPLEDGSSIALVGPNVDEPMLGGGGSSEVTPFIQQSPRSGLLARSEGDVRVERGAPPIEDLSFFREGNESAAEGAQETTIDDAADAARDADVAVVCVRDRTTEARDRPDLRLPGRQDALVETVADATDRVVVVVNSSGPVELPWRESVSAIVENWYPGQAHGAALAAVLFGDVDPGGRLPVTFAGEAAYPTAPARRFPGENGTVQYDEGLHVGYRHFDRSADEVVYPFGHGHSYASFEYGDATPVDSSTVRVPVTNVSDRAGREVVQAYVRPPDRDDFDRPSRELAGFASVSIGAGATRTVEVNLDDYAFGRYDVRDGWTVAPGPYVVEIGRSVADVRTELRVERDGTSL